MPAGKIALKKIRHNDVHILFIEITSKYARRNDVKFSPFKITPKITPLSKQRKSSSIFFFQCIDVISTANRRQFDVLCPLGTQLLLVPEVTISLQMFESQRAKNPVKPALKSPKN